jgi:hypothetical protein
VVPVLERCTTVSQDVLPPSRAKQLAIEAILQGERAFLSGDAEKTNPYSKGSRLFLFWAKGFHQIQKLGEPDVL